MLNTKKLASILLFSFLVLGFSKGQETMQQTNLPAIGKWLLHKDGLPSHWFWEKYKNRTLYEPINVIIIDEFSTSEDDAVKKLMRECKNAGYEEESGHSSGYLGSIDNILYKQIPNDKRMAFSNKEFFVTNNHGRIMGPAYYGGKYIFIGAFSTESFKVFDKAHHRYVSFVRARDDFCKRMNDTSIYRIVGSNALDNIVDDEQFTTADHDGMAIILSATEK